MKNLLTICLVLLLPVFSSLGCKNNLLANYTNQYTCTIAGEPEPVTAQDYGKRAGKHLELNNFSGEFDECAFGAISESIRLDPNNGDAYAIRGNLLYARRNIDIANQDGKGLKKTLEAALEDMDRAIEMIPDRSQFYAVRASIYEASNFLQIDIQTAKTLENLKKAIELSDAAKSRADLLERRGDLYVLAGSNDKAISDYSAAIEIVPDKEALYSKRSAVYLKSGQTDLSVADDMKLFQLKDANKDPEKESPSPKTIDESKTPATISGGIINGKAKKLAKPSYPPAAKAVKAGGAVSVNVTVDENGNVISAKAVSGHPLLRPAAERAAKVSTFSPTLLVDKPVKVNGIIVFEFKP